MFLCSITPKNISTAIDILKKGGVIAHPTDTCYGLAADITNPEAVKKIIDIKKMALDKPMSIAVTNISEMEKYGVMSKKAHNLAKKYLPGALTLLLPKTDQIPSYYYPESNLIGIRIPDFSLMMKLLQGLGKALTTTSANITGQKEPYTGEEVIKMFKRETLQPDFVFATEKSEYKKHQKPSTIVKVVSEKVELIRQGEVEII